MKITLLISIALLLTLSAWSQSGDDPAAPKPAPSAEAAPAEPVEPPAENVAPEKRLPERDHTVISRNATGMEPASNVLNTGFSIRSAVDTNASGMAGAVGTDLFSTLIGNLNLNRERRNYRFGLSYSGGGEIYARHSEWDAPFDHAGVSLEFLHKHWLFAVREEMDYSPNSVTAMRREVPADAISGSVTGLGPNDVPNQSILDGRARQLNNTSALQLDYTLGAKDTFTISGSYGILRFLDGDLIDNQQANGSAGYVHAINPRFKIGAFYNHSIYRYGSFNTTVYSKSAQAYISKLIGRRLNIQVSAGPQFSRSSIVANTTTGVSVDGSGSYQLGQSTLSVGAFRGTSGGAGVLASSTTTSYSAGYARSLSRQWSMSSTASYSTSRATATADILQPAFARTSFISKAASAEVGRMLARGNRAYMRYSAQQGGRSVCASQGCSSNGIRHIIEFGLSWQFRPIRIN